ncbi:MAG: bifunctional folylpolyglutamate synthase/dihydrofolate synthase [Planctomycetes bacterium]|nr:bifunctional folylpolyglutamate synthase/dihydrofolate synthase [Planctomycetota bacterium]
MQTNVNPAHDAALAFLYGRIDYERAISIPYGSGELRLDRMRELLQHLGSPQQQLKIVHVAGTKGKGSTSAMIASILTAAGYRAGLYTSPHLDRLEERVQIDGTPCSADELVALVARLQPAVAEMDASAGPGRKFPSGPTYFELTTAMALMLFAEREVDAAVLEVGLGGRLDSTNVCQPLVTAITSISFDHMEQLGHTLSAIAREKAGIVKPDVPLVSGVLAEEPRTTIAEVCHVQGSRLVQLGADFDVRYYPPREVDHASGLGAIDFMYRNSGVALDYERIPIGLLGKHQGTNAAVALAVCAELRQQGWLIPENAIRDGLSRVRWPARVEVVSRRPAVILDTAHNVASIAALMDALDQSFNPRRRLLVFATTRGKDVRGMLKMLLPAFDHIVFTRYTANPRGIPAEELNALAIELGARPVGVHPDVASAWNEVQTLATEEDLICVTGSFFLAAEIWPMIESGASYRRVSAPPLRGHGSRGAGADGLTTAPPSDGGASALGL